MRLIGSRSFSLSGSHLRRSPSRGKRPSEVRRIGYLPGDVSGLSSAFYEILREGLRDLGYVEGRNLVIEYRSGEDRARLAELAAELVRLKVEVIVTPRGGDLGRQESHGDRSGRVLAQRRPNPGRVRQESRAPRAGTLALLRHGW